MNGKILTSLMCGLLVAAMAGPAAADWKTEDGHKMHFPQYPDPDGWDVNLSPLHVADDWECSQSGPVDDVHFWASWEGDVTGGIVNLFVGILGNVEADPDDPDSYSHPGDNYLWQRWFKPAEFTVRPAGEGDQGWFDPAEPYWNKPDHQKYVQINITDIKDPFPQEKGKIYWLDLQVDVGTSDARLGWKTSQDHFMDDAVYYMADGGVMGWHELFDPIDGQSLDMAFVITPEPATVVLLGIGAAGVLLRRRRR